MPATLLNPDIQEFIVRHQNADVRDLALKKMPNGWPRTHILNHIKARQKATHKLPSWLETHNNILFPPPDLIEQASSDATAHYKASLFRGKRFVDLTGGVGADCVAFAQNFEQVICVEQNSKAANLLAHNLPLLTGKDVEVIRADAETYVQDMKAPIDLVYIDPQRRNDNRKGLKYFQDCNPNILNMLPILLNKAQNILIKTSPMLDVHQALTQLPQTRTVHIVEWRKECREVLYHLTREPTDNETDIQAVSINDNGEPIHHIFFTRTDNENAHVQYASPQKYLYEPGPAFMKAGCYKLLSERFSVSKLHAHTHLYTSEVLVSDFPGRTFKIFGLYPVRKNALPISKINLAIRNFPDDVQGLYKRLNLKAGGDEMAFACTLHDEQKILIHGKII